MKHKINIILKSISWLFFVLLASYQFVLSDWQKIYTLPPGFDHEYYLDVYFLKSNPNYGWSCGFNGSIIRTTDAGKTWKGVHLFGIDQLESIKFADTLNGYTSGPNSITSSGGVIFKSTDGGATWFDISPNPGFNYELWGTFFQTKDLGMVIGGGCDSPQFFFRTTDGGTNWDYSLGNLANSGLTDLELYPDGHGFATSSGYIWQTSDDGVSWSVFCNDGNGDWQEALGISGKSFLMPYSTTCTGGGGNGGARMSVDYGKTWRQTQFGENMFGSYLLDSLRGWVCGQVMAVYYTSDGGRNWILSNCGIVDHDSLDDIYFLDDTTGWVVGTGVYKYVTHLDNKLDVNVVGKTRICLGDSIILTAVQDYRNYLWSDGETTKSISPKQTGEYYLKAWNTRCDTAYSDSIFVLVNQPPKPLIKIPGKPKICFGDSLILKINAQFKSVVWSTGSTDDSIIVKSKGTYSVEVTDTNGCTGSSSINIDVAPLPTPTIQSIGRNNPCKGSDVTLQSIKDYSNYVWLKDNTVIYSGTNYKSIDVKSDGNYSLVVTDSNGCSNISNTINVNFVDDSNRISSIYEHDSLLFAIDTTTLTNMSCALLKITNVSNIPFTLDNAYFIRNIEFSVPQSQFPIIIPPKESVGLKICFYPYQSGKIGDTLVLPDVCSDHYIPVISFGIGNTYTGTSSCNMPITLRSYKLDSKKYVYLVPPYPNPAKSLINLSYVKFSDDGNYSAFRTKIYDIMGRELNIPVQLENVNTYSDNGSYEQGDLVYDISKLSSGSYVIVISYEGSSHVFTFLINGE